MDLCNKYRPKNFDEVIGNDYSIEILLGTLQESIQPHAYLFVGDHGCGKTTLARIMSYKLGSDTNNIVEINSSNNRGIDTAREIEDNSRFRSLSGAKKVYILDEVHRSTKDFQNAMLKILEEPPEHVYFMLCTTEPQGLIKTLRSRCSDIIIEKPNIRDLSGLLQKIIEKEKKEFDKKIVRNIAIKSNCHVRDAIKILEKVINLKDEEKINKIIERGVIDEENAEAMDLCRSLLNGDWNSTRNILKNLKDNEDVERLRRMVLGYMGKVIINSNEEKKVFKAGIIIDCLKNNFFDSGKAGFIQKCLEIFS